MTLLGNFNAHHQYWNDTPSILEGHTINTGMTHHQYWNDTPSIQE